MSRAIKERCLDCVCWQREEVKRCKTMTCPLWRFRTGSEQRDSLYTPTRRGSKQAFVSGDQSVESIVDGEEQ